MILRDQKVLAWQLSYPVQGQQHVQHGNGYVQEHHSLPCMHHQLSPPKADDEMISGYTVQVFMSITVIFSNCLCKQGNRFHYSPITLSCSI